MSDKEKAPQTAQDDLDALLEDAETLDDAGRRALLRKVASIGGTAVSAAVLLSDRANAGGDVFNSPGGGTGF